MPKNKAGLNPRQERFVLAYLACLNATQAAIEAGYSQRTAQRIGSENLYKPLIAAEIERQMEKLRKRHTITADYVIETIVDTIERARKGERVPANALKGCELLGKHLGLFGEPKTPKRGLQEDPRLQAAIDKLVPKKSASIQ